MTKEIIAETKYLKYYYEEEHSLLISEWLPTSEEMEDEDFKESAILTAELCEEYKPKTWMVDSRALLYTVEPDLHAWVDQELTPRYQAAGITKMAIIFIPPEDPEEIVFEKLSTEQLMEEEHLKEAWQTEFFTTINEARTWLLN